MVILIWNIVIILVSTLLFINRPYAATPYISGGAIHSLSLKNDGIASSWGYNGYGQLGNNSTNNTQSSVDVSTLIDITAVTAGSYHSMALKNDGTVWAWGHNGYGQLGNNSTTHSSIPVQVTGLTNCDLPKSYHTSDQISGRTI